jgi:precorrin-2 dehydrogenase
MCGYPLELDLREKTTIVVGFGKVGRRKASGLIQAGARVLAIDPAGKDEESVRGVELIAEAYDPRHLSGAVLVWAAASPEVNRRVVADARALGIWVGSASSPSSGDFTAPAVWRNGPLQITVSTSGASPGLAATLRDHLARAVPQGFAELITLLWEIRPDILERIRDPEARRTALAVGSDPKWVAMFETHETEEVRRLLLKEIERVIRSQDDGVSHDTPPFPPPRYSGDSTPER